MVIPPSHFPPGPGACPREGIGSVRGPRGCVRPAALRGRAGRAAWRLLQPPAMVKADTLAVPVGNVVVAAGAHPRGARSLAALAR